MARILTGEQKAEELRETLERVLNLTDEGGDFIDLCGSRFDYYKRVPEPQSVRGVYLGKFDALRKTINTRPGGFLWLVVEDVLVEDEGEDDVPKSFHYLVNVSGVRVRPEDVIEAMEISPQEVIDYGVNPKEIFSNLHKTADRQAGSRQAQANHLTGVGTYLLGKWAECHEAELAEKKALATAEK